MSAAEVTGELVRLGYSRYDVPSILRRARNWDGVAVKFGTDDAHASGIPLIRYKSGRYALVPVTP